MTAISKLSTRPLLWLDIDGVVRAWRDTQCSYRGYKEVTVSDDVITQNILYRPAVVRAIAQVVKRGVEVRWLTMWGSASRSLFGPALGFPDLVNAVDSPPRGGGEPGPSVASLCWWKKEFVREALKAEPNRPMMWIDDSISVDMLHFWSGPPNLSYIIPDESLGLDRWDVIAVSRWSRNPSRQVRPDSVRGRVPGELRVRSYPTRPARDGDAS